MRGFLFDENLPQFRPFVQIGYNARLQIGSASNRLELWLHARDNDLAIVTKDADFSQRIVLSAPPPRVVQLRVGNMRRRDFDAWLQSVWPRIESLVPKNKLVAAYHDRIEAVK